MNTHTSKPSRGIPVLHSTTTYLESHVTQDLRQRRRRAHAKISRGTYIIVNQVPCSDGTRRATTFHGPGNPLIVTPDQGGSQQRWFVKDYIDETHHDETQIVSPLSDLKSHCSPNNSIVTARPGNVVGWIITQTPNDNFQETYTIQNGTDGEYWGVSPAGADPRITLGAGTGGKEQNWLFYRAR